MKNEQKVSKNTYTKLKTCRTLHENDKNHTNSIGIAHVMTPRFIVLNISSTHYFILFLVL